MHLSRQCDDRSWRNRNSAGWTDVFDFESTVFDVDFLCEFD